VIIFESGNQKVLFHILFNSEIMGETWDWEEAPLRIKLMNVKSFELSDHSLMLNMRITIEIGVEPSIWAYSDDGGESWKRDASIKKL